MRKLGVFLIGVILSFAFLCCGFGRVDATVKAAADENIVYVGGMSAGFTLKTGGVQIIGICEVVSESGVKSPALNAGLKSGDKIRKINGISIENVPQLNEIVHQSEGKSLNVEIERSGEEFTVSVLPLKDKIGERYKIGVLVKDSVSGIGTITYIDKKNRKFGSLGHSVTGESEKEMKISDGSVYACTIVGVNKGTRGKAGELRGMFLSDQKLGNANKICNCGIFGEIDENFGVQNLTATIADSNDAKPGNAYIYSTVNGTQPKKYNIEIVKVDKGNKENKHYVIKINDKELISETGGIVQGMSGSPILQDGKLIGAVTHVFLNDPTRGFGINIQTMLDEQ